MSRNPNPRSGRSSGKNKSKKALLAPLPLLPNEDPAAYKAYLKRIIRAVKPSDFIEEVWATKCADLDWQEMRLERFKREYIESSTREGLKNLILMHPKFKAEEEFFDQWILGNREARSNFNSILKQANLTDDAVYAHTYVAKLEALEGIERRIEAIVKRRSKIMHEIEQRRDFFAQKLKNIRESERSRYSASQTGEIAEAAE
jgi:hypothetical protein